MAAKTKKKTPMPKPKPEMTKAEKKRQDASDAMARYNAIDSEEKPKKPTKKRYGGSVKIMARGGSVKKMARGGKVKKMARGGIVKGPYS